MLENKRELDPYVFPVSTQPVAWISDDYIHRIVPDSHAVVRTDTNQAISVVSKDYELLPNLEFVGIIDHALREVGVRARVDQHYMTSSGGRFGMTLTCPDLKVTMANGEEMFYMFWAENSYNRTRSARLAAGAMRIICVNGMVIGVEQVDVRFPHMSGLSEKIEVVAENLALMAERSEEGIVTLYDSMQVRIPDLAPERTLNYVQAKTSLPDRYMNPIREMVKNDEGYFGPVPAATNWDLYNVYTDAVSHLVPSLFRRQQFLGTAASVFPNLDWDKVTQWESNQKAEGFHAID